MSRLDEIRARLAAAPSFAITTEDAVTNAAYADCEACQARDFDECVHVDAGDVIEFVAHAADDLAFLLAEVERLTGEAAAERAERMTPEQLWKHHLAASYSVDPGAAWQHVRTGAVYEVLGVALREADCEPLVLYRLRDEGFVNPRRGVPTWARPVSEFLDGRFVRVDE